MKLQELKNVKLTDTAPPADMTDDLWQEYFRTMKLLTSQSKDTKMNCRGYKANSQFAYHGETQWFRHCQFINSVLNTIRHGEPDYCFYIYQIAQLLKFEHDRLNTEWLPDDKCFKVWLA